MGEVRITRHEPTAWVIMRVLSVNGDWVGEYHAIRGRAARSRDCALSGSLRSLHLSSHGWL